MHASQGTPWAANGIFPIAVLALLGCPARTWALAPDDAATKAAGLVRQALEAEASGDRDARGEYLRQALAADPDYPPAHWQLGEVRHGSEWVTVDELSRDPVRQRRFDAYHRLAAKNTNTWLDEHALANFCDRNGMHEQEQVHLANMLRLIPNSPDVRQKLGLMRYNGEYMTPAQFAAVQAEEHLRDVTVNTWVPRLVALRKDITGGQNEAREKALGDLRAIRDPEAIPALEAATKLSPAAVGKAVVASLSEMRGQSATDSLVRHAVLAQDAELRQAAVDEIRSRSVYATVPTLLKFLQLPVDIRLETFFLDDGRAGHRLALFQEGETEKQSYASLGAEDVSVDVTNHGSTVNVRSDGDKTLSRDQGLAQAVQQYNVRQSIVNERATAALRTTTGENLPADPKLWWQWWANYNELYSQGEKPVSYMTSFARPQPVRVSYHSCFVPGTTVWTAGGPLAIEKIHLGELVLAQNVDSGELAYKPVVATTVGPQVRPLVEIVAGGEMIRCTYGHLFWVSGTGWQMAKELKAGQWLHTAHGPILIDSVEKKGEAVCHNLIVADFNTFFVTDKAFLVHDINVRSPTDATVPGLVEPGNEPVISQP
jgi:hypothetical protein